MQNLFLTSFDFMKEQILVEQVKKEQLDVYFQTFCRLINELFPEYSERVRRFFYTDPRAINREGLDIMFNRGDILLAAHNQVDIMGILIAGKPFGGVSTAHWFAIDPAYQGRGLGTRMVRTYEDLVSSMGAHSIRFETAAKNRKYYQRYGYQLIGFDETSTFGTPNDLFRKLLQEPQESNFLK